MVTFVRFCLVIPAYLFFLGVSVPAQADIKAVVSLKPVHSLVSLVMGDKGTVSLLVDGAASPHTYALTPNQASDIQNADVVFWIGESLESFLEKPVQTIGASARQIKLLATPGIKTLGFREGGAFDAHGHAHARETHESHDEHKDHNDHHDHEGHDDHENHNGHNNHDGHDDHKDHEGHNNHDGHDDHKDHDGHAHAEDGVDPHIWLSPENAKAMLHHIAHVLGEIDPNHAAVFENNAEQAITQVDRLSMAIKTELSPHKGAEFIVFHDAYHYFEEAFGLQAAGAISINPERMPGAQRVVEIRSLLADDHIKCVFTEPQFEAKIVRTILEGTDRKAIEIDPLGSALPSGPGLYFELLDAMKSSFLSCLG